MRKQINQTPEPVDEFTPALPAPSMGEMAIGEGKGIAVDMDQLFMSARRFPRDMEAVRVGVLQEITDPEVAEKLTYRFTRKSKTGELEEVIGISIRGAEIILQYMENVLVRGYAESRLDGIYGVGMAIDLQRRIVIIQDVKSRQLIPGEDGLVLAINTAISKAIRNCILRLVPYRITKEFRERARAVMRREIKREGVLIRFQKAVVRFRPFGLNEGDLLNRLGVSSADQLTEDHILQLLELYNALEEGQVSPDTIRGTSEVSKPTSLGDILKGGK